MSIAILLTKSDPATKSPLNANTEPERSIPMPPLTNKVTSGGWSLYFKQFSVVYNGVMAKK